MNFNTKYLIFSFILFANASIAQEYSPIIPGKVKHFKMNNASYTKQILMEKVSKGGKEYFQSLTKYSWGDSITILLRIDEEGNEIYLDPVSGTESIDFPKNISAGNTWVSTDGAWKYEIFKTGATLVTPLTEYKNCLVIRAQQLTGRDKNKLGLYYNYYADQVGYIGSENSKGLMSWIVEQE